MHTKTYTKTERDGKSAKGSRRIKTQPSATTGVARSLPFSPAVDLPTCLVEAVDTAVAEAFAKTYSSDPLIPDEVAALRGPVDSVLRRHGLLIESALAVALAQSPGTEVMTQVAVPLSEAAIQLCLSNADDRTIGLTLPVTGAVAKSAMLDVVVYYPGIGRLVAVSVKRGGGPQGGVAARQAPIELRAAAMILRGMLMNRGRVVSTVDVVTVDYLGRSGIVAGTVITGDQLDGFFGVPVRATMDAMTEYMAAEVGRRIDEAVEMLVRRRFPQTSHGLSIGTSSQDDSIDEDNDLSDPALAEFDAGSSHRPRAQPSESLPTLAACLADLPKAMRRRSNRLHA